MNALVLSKLQDGYRLLGYKERGNSMVPFIYSREPVHVYPVNVDMLEVGDIVIARVRGQIFCHLISALEGDRVQISNSSGHVNGWTHRSKVYGIVTHISGRERPGAMAKVTEWKS